VKKPLHNIWLDLGQHSEGVGEHKVDLMVRESKEDINNKNSDFMQQKHELTLFFTSEGSNSIDTLLTKHASGTFTSSGPLKTIRDTSMS
jgi:hypothetical protein